MKTISFLVLFFISLTTFAQNSTQYTDNNGQTHLCGPFNISDLESDSTYSTWFNKYYNDYKIPEGINTEWNTKLKDYEVEIYLGTWCGDSKYWVSRFVKLWDDLGLNREQLTFTALYDTEDQYKVGPNHEEQGKYIHRVPTFIFKKDGEEKARIVESPVNNLHTDLAQIALEFPSKPNYRAANFAMYYFESTTIEEIEKQYDALYKSLQYLCKQSKELNTLGYVFLKRKEIEKALLIFKLNKELFKFEPNVYDSYAEGLIKANKPKEAINQYKEVLKFDPLNQHAKTQIKRLKRKKK